MVIPGGLEPPTYCLEGSCSIQLSYGTVFSKFTKPHIAVLLTPEGFECKAQSGAAIPCVLSHLRYNPLCLGAGNMISKGLTSGKQFKV